MHCASCRSILPADAAYCPACGTPTHAATGPTTRLAAPLPRAMPDGLCPQCGGENIYMDDAGLMADRVPLKLNLHVFLFPSASIITYLCADCGYVTIHAAFRAEIDGITQKWQRVPKKER